MKKLLAIFLTTVMCVSMAACGSSPAEPEKETTSEPQTEQTANTESEQQEEKEPETSGEQGFETICVLSPEKADEFYQAVSNGEVQGPIADALRTMDEYKMKCMLDVLAMFFGEEELLGQLEAFNAGEADQILAEASGMLNEFLSEDEEVADEGTDEGFMDGMPTTMTLYNGDLDRRFIVEFDPEHAFMEPDWANFEESSNWFISIDDDYSSQTLVCGRLDIPTDELIDNWIEFYTNKGITTTATEVETFTAGGMEWELFALTYEKEGSGIDKETGKEVTFTDEVFETICFTRPDSESYIQLDIGTANDISVLEYCKEIIQKSIKNITVQ